MHNTTPAPSGGTPLLAHGTLTAYHRHGCRCDPCTRRAVTHDATRRRLKAYGRWQPAHAAEPIRAHLQALQQVPLTNRAIALRAGLNEQRIRQILATRYQTVRSSDALKILAVTVPDTPPPSHLPVDATATRRRLQALTAVGYSLPAVLRAMGRTGERNLRDVIHGRQDVVAVATAVAVETAYNQLWDQEPTTHGVLPRHVNRARALAARHRWALPMAWDDDSIGDPATMPNWTGRCGTPGGYYDHGQLGTPTCQPCRDAVAAAAAERKARRRARQSAA